VERRKERKIVFLERNDRFMSAGVQERNLKMSKKNNRGHVGGSLKVGDA